MIHWVINTQILLYFFEIRIPYHSEITKGKNKRNVSIVHKVEIIDQIPRESTFDEDSLEWIFPQDKT